MSVRPSEATHRSLIERLKSADSEGWDRLVTLYRPLIWHWARQEGIPPQDFEDIRQDVFRVVVERIGTFELGERFGSFRAWLKGITHNICRERARRNAGPRGVGGTEAAIRLNEAADPANDDDPPDLVAGLIRQATALVRGEFSDLHWAVFERLVFQFRSTAEVAAELGQTEVNVRAIKSRIYRRLREELGDVCERARSAKSI